MKSKNTRRTITRFLLLLKENILLHLPPYKPCALYLGYCQSSHDIQRQKYSLSVFSHLPSLSDTNEALSTENEVKDLHPLSGNRL